MKSWFNNTGNNSVTETENTDITQHGSRWSRLRTEQAIKIR
jgi:hypothetical protein